MFSEEPKRTVLTEIHEMGCEKEEQQPKIVNEMCKLTSLNLKSSSHDDQ
jgi:hypothetical protein